MDSERAVIVDGKSFRRTPRLHSGLLDCGRYFLLFAAEREICSSKLRVDSAFSVTGKVAAEGKPSESVDIRIGDVSVERMASADSESPVAKVSVVVEG